MHIVEVLILSAGAGAFIRQNSWVEPELKSWILQYHPSKYYLARYRSKLTSPLIGDWVRGDTSSWQSPEPSSHLDQKLSKTPLGCLYQITVSRRLALDRETSVDGRKVERVSGSFPPQEECVC